MRQVLIITTILLAFLTIAVIVVPVLGVVGMLGIFWLLQTLGQLTTWLGTGLVGGIVLWLKLAPLLYGLITLAR